MIVPLFLGWIKVGAPHSDVFTFLSTHNWKMIYNYLLKTYFVPSALGMVSRGMGFHVVLFLYPHVYNSSKIGFFFTPKTL